MMVARDGPIRGPLTPRQRGVALLVAAGCRNVEIAQRLRISEQTVKNHLKAIFERLGVASRLQLAAYVHRHRSGRRGDSTWPFRVTDSVATRPSIIPPLAR